MMAAEQNRHCHNQSRPEDPCHSTSTPTPGKLRITSKDTRPSRPNAHSNNGFTATGTTRSPPRRPKRHTRRNPSNLLASPMWINNPVHEASHPPTDVSEGPV